MHKNIRKNIKDQNSPSGHKKWRKLEKKAKELGLHCCLSRSGKFVKHPNHLWIQNPDPSPVEEEPHTSFSHSHSYSHP